MDKPDTAEVKSIFGDRFDSFLFKANIRIYHKEFSGLLVTKQMRPRDYRVIFTTELGMKLFDFEFSDTTFTLHYCVPQFNRPALIQIIQQDIRILLMTYPHYGDSALFTDASGQYRISKVEQQDASCNYYFRELKSRQLVKIEHARKNIKKTTFVLDQYSEDIPGHIVIQHHDIKLKTALTRLKK